jgi:two-component system, NarL family, response regulator
LEKPIRVLIADDHLLFRLGLQSALNREPSVCLIGEASTGKETVETCARLQPDVLVLDLRMPEGGGIGALQALSEQFPQIRVLVLSSYANEEEIHQTMDAGALGYMLKDASTESLVQAIRQVHEGKKFIPGWVEEMLRQRASKPDLTVRELEVLKLLVNGLTNREISRVLGNSENTVRNHTINLFEKLEVSDRAEAVSVALQRGIVIPEDGNHFRGR